MTSQHTVVQRTVLIVFVLSFCSRANTLQLKYVWGDAFDDPSANGPDGDPYPWDEAAKIASKQIRAPRRFPGVGGEETLAAHDILSPKETRKILLSAFQAQERGEYVPAKAFRTQAKIPENKGPNEGVSGHRQGRVIKSKGMMTQNSLNQSTFIPSMAQSDNSQNKKGIQGNRVTGDILASSSGDSAEGCVPSRLCPSTYNTTAPLYGVSLTSGQPVTIVQKFPDLLQQVVFQVCKTSECEVLQGECVQTYLPYLFLVIPLGPVTLTGQDYVLVESGCVCRPKYARKHDEPPPLPFIQPLQH